MCGLQKADRRVAELVGVNQAHLQKLVQSGPRRNVSEADLEKERICKRFFMALMLNDVIQEVPCAVLPVFAFAAVFFLNLVDSAS